MTHFNILVVEDEKIISLDLCCILQRMGHTVVATAGSWCESKAFLHDTRVDLIFMDINLKGELSGIEIARQFTEIRQLPIIFLSGSSETELIRQLAGNNDIKRYAYIIKPFNNASIKKAMAEIEK